MVATGACKIAYGQERPLDHVLQSKPYLAFEFGLFTGSVVRWYVEGETEYHAVHAVIPHPETHGIELINLRGSIEAERSNAALKLHDGLLQDLALRRISMISFDMDVPAARRAVRRQVEEGNVVGFIAAHDPDFEFANFTVAELVEIAARIDEKHGVSGDAVRNADWTGVACGRAFEDRYKAVSARKPRGLKGKEWGRALAAYASEHSSRGDDDGERVFWRSIRTALQGRFAHYDHTREHRGFDPDSFASIERQVPHSEEEGAQRTDIGIEPRT